MKTRTKVIIIVIILLALLGGAFFVVYMTGLLPFGKKEHKHGATQQQTETEYEADTDIDAVPKTVKGYKDHAQKVALKAAETMEGEWGDKFKSFVSSGPGEDATQTDEYKSLKLRLQGIVGGKHLNDDEDEDSDDSTDETTSSETSTDESTSQESSDSESTDSDSEDSDSSDSDSDSKSSDKIEPPVHVYTLIKKEDSFLMAVDSYKNAEAYGTDHGSSAPMTEAFESELIAAERSAHKTKDGYVWTAYAPVFDSYGNVVCIVGVDVEAPDMEEYPEWDRESDQWNKLEE